MRFWQRVLAKLREEDSPPIFRHLPIDRDEISARNLGYALLRLARGSNEADAMHLKHLEDLAGIDLDQVGVELICLRAFVIDFAVWNVVKDEAQRNIILDAFYDAMAGIAGQDSAGAALVGRIKNRILTYSEAIKEPSDLGPAWPIGKAFATFCGSESIHDIMPGIIEFATTLKEVSGFLKKFRVAG